MPFQPGHPKFGGSKIKPETTARLVAQVAARQEVQRIVTAAVAGKMSVAEAMEAELPEATANSILPLQAMLVCLRWAMAENDRAGVLAAASAAAPYIHPKLIASTLTVSGSLDTRPTSEILIELTALRLKAEAASDEASNTPEAPVAPD